MDEMDVDATGQHGTKRVAEAEAQDASKPKKIKVSGHSGTMESDVY